MGGVGGFFFGKGGVEEGVKGVCDGDGKEGFLVAWKAILFRCF